MMRRIAIVGLALLGFLPPVLAAELVMFERKGCPYCAAWEREVAAAYGQSAEGRRLPLRRVDVDGPIPADLAFVRGIRFTPTFVIVGCGREVGRIVGYTADYQFWGRLADELGHLDEPALAGC